jgi:thiosulfate dehydrogenase (quinone) large subunit
MNASATQPRFAWRFDYLREHPLQLLGVALVLAMRYFFAAFFIYGFWHKWEQGWIWTDIMKLHFIDRYAEIDMNSFQALYLQYFGIPLYVPIAFIVTVGELIIGLGLVFGVATRANAAFGLFMLLNFTAGAFYNIWIVILSAMAALFIVLPTGHWLGFDKRLNEKYPNSIWFK